MSFQKPRLNTYTLIGFQLNAALSRNEYEACSFSEIYSAIEENRVLDLLKSKAPNLDVSFISAEEAEKLQRALEQVAGGLEGRERRKVGVEDSGIHLMVAFLFEAIQQELYVTGY